jgi:hypothetical protein
MTTKMQDEKPDIIIINGDFNYHGASSRTPGVDNWSKMVPIFTTIMQMISNKFPGVPILPTIGNNDVKYHYQAPKAADKASYYGDLYSIFFTNVPANAKYSKIGELQTSFMESGSYIYDISDTLSFLGINSIYFNSKNKEDFTEADALMTWI